MKSRMPNVRSLWLLMSIVKRFGRVDVVAREIPERKVMSIGVNPVDTGDEIPEILE